MNIFQRFLAYLDEQVSRPLDRHLELALPSRSPDRLPSRAAVEKVGTDPCCRCCASPGFLCVETHRSPCDSPECGQGWSA